VFQRYDTTAGRGSASNSSNLLRGRRLHRVRAARVMFSSGRHPRGPVPGDVRVCRRAA